MTTMKHPSNFATLGTRYTSPASPWERVAAGRYFVEKLVDPGTPTERWAIMSYGNGDQLARPGRELDVLIRRAVVLEGRVRIRRRDDVIVWESPSPVEELAS